ncbi:DUF6701 domain-containing protein [Massilia sp. TWR1-2-2]|uniref:DUF6701 domain-containing protein n=1 Tax=Massilia sp. TWR1-2-2 TaxID=2804584 RepID=UPI003CE9A419
MAGLLQARIATLLGAVVLALACGAARADTPLAIFKSFAGNVNFVGTQKTMRTRANGGGNAAKACAVTASGTDISAVLSGIPSGATVLSAQLYWAGSSATRDNTVTFDGVGVTAPASRQYGSNTTGAGYVYFGGAVDVTAQVAAKGNGTYRFSGLTINNGAPYCDVEGVLGGFALLVVFSDPGEPFRLLNLYEGFQYVQNGSITLTLGNFRMPTPIGTATARVGHLSWEGDPTLSSSEDLEFNNVELVDSLNPAHNQFNSSSNVNDDNASYGIDFDAYTIGKPGIGDGQTSATAYYQTGQDLVLLNAQIIAVPNVPAADLAIAMTRTSELVLGQNATYTLAVSNGGPSVETGPVIVTDTLPAGLSFVGSSGTGWSCTSSGKVVTCSNSASLAAGGSLPTLTLTVSVDATGTQVNTASVEGKQFDYIMSNNSASDSAIVSGSAASYVFTDAACQHGVAFGAAQQPCKLLAGAPAVAGEATPLFVTALVNGVPTRLSASADTVVKMAFALSCILPVSDAGVKANYAGVQLQLCGANGAVPAAAAAQWSPLADMLFKSGAASAVANASFDYADVGKVQLYLRDASARVVGALPFVVKPSSLAITAVTRSADGFANPQATTGAGAVFVRVGDPFTVRAAAFTKSGAQAPNFGNEGELLKLVAARGADSEVQAAMVVVNDPGGQFTAVVGGVFVGTEFTIGDAGIVTLTPLLTDNSYLGAGAPASVATLVGRFYPHHFDTVANAAMQCMPNMACPASVSGAAYSGQPFSVTVMPMSAAGAELKNFNGVLARTITLTAFSASGGATTNPAGGVLSANMIPTTAMVAGQPIIAKPVYTLPVPFSNTAPRARNWTAPTPVFVRASAADTATVTSPRPAGSVEIGVTVVSGRLSLSSPHGSELLKLPVKAVAQYWAPGGRWESNDKDNVSTVLSGGITFANCRKQLGTPCNLALLGVTASATLTMKNGATLFWLRAPGAGNVGSGEFQMNNPPWLPSTIGRAVFGIYKSPLIYVREVY